MKKILLFLSVPFLFACNEANTVANKTEISSGNEHIIYDSVAKTTMVKLYAGDDMVFSLKEIRIKAGSKVTVELTHTGKMDKYTMGHNFVLLKEGVKAGPFGAKVISMKDTDFLPKDDMSEVIAHTGLIGGGEVTSVTFDAPAPGVYEYLCSFAGHAAMMKGKLIVE